MTLTKTISTAPSSKLALTVALSATLMACNAPLEPNDGERYQAFVDASAESAVPTEILLAVSYEATRWETPDIHDHEVAEGPPRHGVMGLSEAQVAAGAMRTGLTYEEILTDTPANIRASAAALAAIAERILGEDFAETARIEDWRDVLAEASDMPDAIAMDYADEVMIHVTYGASRTLHSGEVIELIGSTTLPPVLESDTDSSDSSFGTSQQNLSASSSLVDQVRPANSSNYSRGRSRAVDMIVIHTVQGSYNGCISWFQNGSANVSAHYVIRSRDGHITQMVDEGDTGWHVRNSNSRAIGLEHEGYVSDAAWYTDAMYRKSAALVCNIARRHGLPLDRQHIVGHVEVPGNNHTDPGRHWDWGKYMSLVREACGQSGGGSTGGGSTGGGSTGGGSTGGGSTGGGSTGSDVRLQGIIYKAPSQSARISGATVRVAGKTVRTNSNGYYSVNVSSGTHSITASASGYEARSIQRAVTTGTWGSIGLPVATSTSTGGSGSGQLVGVIYAAPNTGSRIAGATVRLSDGKSTTTNSDGYFAFAVGSGTYTVTATKSGFEAGSVRRQVRGGDKVWGSVGLNRQSQSQTGGSATLIGVVYAAPNTGDRLPGAGVRLSNGAFTNTDSSGVFRFTVTPGSYRITATASGYASNSVARTAESGQETWGSVGLLAAEAATGTGSLIGVVYATAGNGDSENRISGASVWTSTGQRTTTGSDGVYTLTGVPTGPVQVFASKTGFRDGGVSRVIESGARTWGSVPLTRRDASAGAEGGIDGLNDTITDGTTDGDDSESDFLLISPIDLEIVGSNPTLVWEDQSAAVDPETHTYLLGVADGPNEEDMTIYDVAMEPADPTAEPPADPEAIIEMSFDIPDALDAGEWGWAVIVIDENGEMVLMSDVGEFLVE